MCNHPKMRLSRDFLHLARCATLPSYRETVDYYLSQLPDEQPFMTVCSCSAEKFVMNVNICLQDFNVPNFHHFICQNAEGDVVVSPEGLDFVKQTRDNIEKGVELPFSTTPLAFSGKLHHPEEASLGERKGH